LNNIYNVTSQCRLKPRQHWRL